MRNPIRLEKSNAQIFPYSSITSLRMLEKFETVIESKTTMAVSTIHIFSGRSGSLLSFTAARNLGLIALPLNSVSTTAIPTSQELRDQYPQLFKGIGQLQDFEVTFHIDPPDSSSLFPLICERKSQPHLIIFCNKILSNAWMDLHPMFPRLSLFQRKMAR